MIDTSSPTEKQDPTRLALTEIIHATRLIGNADPSRYVSTHLATVLMLDLAKAGYAIVPWKMTQEMLNEGIAAATADEEDPWSIRIVLAWRAMLEAAER